MGQYYKALKKEGNGKLTVYNRNIIVDGKEEYMMAKPKVTRGYSIWQHWIKGHALCNIPESFCFFCPKRYVP